jgi:hypothetical protein
LLLSQAFQWESLLRWDLGYNSLLSQAFPWESLLRWDLGYNLLLSRAFRWESLLRWDLGLHGAFGYQGASFLKHFFLFFNLGYHRALSRIFLSHGEIQAKTEPFSQTFLSLNGTQAITESFHGIILSLWDFVYHGSFSWNHSFTLGFWLSRSLFMESFFHFGISAHGAFSWNHSFTVGFRLSQGLFMESFFTFGYHKHGFS